MGSNWSGWSWGSWGKRGSSEQLVVTTNVLVQISWPNLSCFVSHQNWQAHWSKDRNFKVPCDHCFGPKTCGKTTQASIWKYVLYHVTVTLCFLMRHNIFLFYPWTLIATTTRNKFDSRRRHLTNSNYRKERQIKLLWHYLTPKSKSNTICGTHLLPGAGRSRSTIPSQCITSLPLTVLTPSEIGYVPADGSASTCRPNLESPVTRGRAVAFRAYPETLLWTGQRFRWVMIGQRDLNGVWTCLLFKTDTIYHPQN